MAAGGVWRKAYGDQNKASEISAAVSLRASGEEITDSVKDMRMTVTALWHTGAQWPDRTAVSGFAAGGTLKLPVRPGETGRYRRMAAERQVIWSFGHVLIFTTAKSNRLWEEA